MQLTHEEEMGKIRKDLAEWKAYIKQYREDHPNDPPDSWMAAVPVGEET